MLFSVPSLTRQGALIGAGILLATAIAGCQGVQSAPTVRPTAAASSSQATNQMFGGQLPAVLPQDPAAGFGSVEVIQGTSITLTSGRAGFAGGQGFGGQAPESQTPRARTDGGQGGQFQGGQAQRGQGQVGQGQGAFASSSTNLIILEPATKYFKGVAAAGMAPGAPGAATSGTQQPGGARPSGTPQAGSAPQPPGGAAQNDGGRGDRQFAMTAEPATVADIQVGSLVMVWGSVIDGRVYADVVYILPTGPGR